MPMEPMRRGTWNRGRRGRRRRGSASRHPGSLALRDAEHVDDLALGENRDREDVAGLAGERLGEADFVSTRGVDSRPAFLA